MPLCLSSRPGAIPDTGVYLNIQYVMRLLLQKLPDDAEWTHKYFDLLDVR